MNDMRHGEYKTNRERVAEAIARRTDPHKKEVDWLASDLRSARADAEREKNTADRLRLELDEARKLLKEVHGKIQRFLERKS